MRVLWVLLFIAVPTHGAAACAPPCGEILPLMDIAIEDKPACGGARLIFATEPPEDCYGLLEPGEQRIIPASFSWYWEVSEEGTYPKEPGKDIEISFSGASLNPSWITSSVESPDMVDGAFLIDDAALVDPENFEERNDGTPSLWFVFQRDIDIVLTRTGDPGDRDVAMIDDNNGVVKFFIKSESTESSSRFKPSFGNEELRFMACTDEEIAREADICPYAVEDRDAPMPLSWLLLGLLAMLARRRSA